MDKYRFGSAFCRGLAIIDRILDAGVEEMKARAFTQLAICAGSRPASSALGSP
jgi:hypothetical protein